MSKLKQFFIGGVLYLLGTLIMAIPVYFAVNVLGWNFTYGQSMAILFLTDCVATYVKVMSKVL